MAISFDSASVQEVERFILGCQTVIEQEARRAVRRCQFLTVDDLYAQAVLHVVEVADRLMVGANPVAYTRIAVRNYLAGYTLVHDSLVRTPLGHRRETQPAPVSCLCLSRPVGGDDSGVTLADALAAPGQGGQEVAALRQALNKLTEQQRAVLLVRFGGEGSRLRSFRVVAKEAGIPLSSVHRLIQEALAELRRELAGEVTA